MPVVEGKQVSWVELHLDLVFVLAIGQLARLIVDRPEMQSVRIALGLFAPLWWTWVGFAVLYDRHGADEPRTGCCSSRALAPHAYLWLLTAWVVMCAVLTTRTSGRVAEADLERYLGGGRRREAEVP